MKLDTLKVLIPNVATLSVTSVTATLTDLEAVLKISLLALTICYTAWQWRRDTKKNAIANTSHEYV